jgi:hypothetical protein
LGLGLSLKIGLPSSSRSIQWLIAFNTLILGPRFSCLSHLQCSNVRREERRMCVLSLLSCCIIHHCCKIRITQTLIWSIMHMILWVSWTFLLHAKLQMGHDGSNAVCNGGRWNDKWITMFC